MGRKYRLIVDGASIYWLFPLLVGMILGAVLRKFILFDPYPLAAIPPEATATSS